MILKPNLHLGYCTNIHRGQTWPEIFDSLKNFTLSVRDRVAPGRLYGIGLRLSDQASRQLIEPGELAAFQRWLDVNACYVFTINGFPYGRFHGAGVKERVYLPDWTSLERLEYTNRLFDILAQLLPDGVEGSVSTLPGGFKALLEPNSTSAIAENLRRCAAHISETCRKSARYMTLGLEPEPLCLLETTSEACEFFELLRSEDSELVDRCIGINYDTCHQAVEFEEPAEAVGRLKQAGIKISKFHLSSALRGRPGPELRSTLAGFANDTYLHQVVVRKEDGTLIRFRDLCDVLAADDTGDMEWRIHFHVPLHAPPGAGLLSNTNDHLLGVLDLLKADPQLCSNLEMETYTWEVMPGELKNRAVEDQIASEYAWCIKELNARQLAS